MRKRLNISKKALRQHQIFGTFSTCQYKEFRVFLSINPVYRNENALFF